MVPVFPTALKERTRHTTAQQALVTSMSAAIIGFVTFKSIKHASPSFKQMYKLH